MRKQVWKKMREKKRSGRTELEDENKTGSDRKEDKVSERRNG